MQRPVRSKLEQKETCSERPPENSVSKRLVSKSRARRKHHSKIVWEAYVVSQRRKEDMHYGPMQRKLRGFECHKMSNGWVEVLASAQGASLRISSNNRLNFIPTSQGRKDDLHSGLHQLPKPDRSHNCSHHYPKIAQLSPLRRRELLSSEG
jgi:hypothetical protein